jgi:hypothetical protein
MLGVKAANMGSSGKLDAVQVSWLRLAKITIKRKIAAQIRVKQDALLTTLLASRECY